MPQKEDFLKATSPSSIKSDNDHGNSCVCKDCRAKKVGKGSLFQNDKFLTYEENKANIPAPTNAESKIIR